MELYNNPNDINDKKIVLDVLRKKYPNYAEQLKTSRIYADMAAMGFPVAAAVKTIGAVPAAYAKYQSNKTRAPATGSYVRSVGGKTRRNRRSLKQRKRKHSRRRR